MELYYFTAILDSNCPMNGNIGIDHTAQHFGWSHHAYHSWSHHAVIQTALQEAPAQLHRGSCDANHVPGMRAELAANAVPDPIAPTVARAMARESCVDQTCLSCMAFLILSPTRRKQFE